jgi:DNA-binding NarL/FixJ family response regulator
MPLSVVLVDDHAIVLDGYRAVLSREQDVEVVGQALDGKAAVELAARLQPDVLVLDLSMPGRHGLDILRDLAERAARTRVVVASMYDSEAHAHQALQSGARGYVCKQGPVADLVAAIRTVAEGRRFVGPQELKLKLDRYERAVDAHQEPLQPYDTLTDREREVLTRAAAGHSNATTAAQLGVSERTVEAHRLHMMRKMGFDSHAALVRWATRMGFISD